MSAIVEKLHLLSLLARESRRIQTRSCCLGSLYHGRHERSRYGKCLWWVSFDARTQCNSTNSTLAIVATDSEAMDTIQTSTVIYRKGRLYFVH